MSRPFRRTDLSRGSAANSAGILAGRRSGGPIWQRQCHGPCGDRRREAVGRVGLAEIVEVRQSAGPIWCGGSATKPAGILEGNPERSAVEAVPQTLRGSWKGAHRPDRSVEDSAVCPAWILEGIVVGQTDLSWRQCHGLCGDLGREEVSQKSQHVDNGFGVSEVGGVRGLGGVCVGWVGCMWGRVVGVAWV